MAESYQNPNFDNQNFQNNYPAPPIQELRVGFGKRFGAYLVDILFIALLSGIISFALPIKDTFLWKEVGVGLEKQRTEMEEKGMPDDQIDMSIGIAETFAQIGILAGIVGLLYSLVELFTGSSPAKHIFGIIAAHENGTQGNLGLWGARWFIKSSSSILSVIGMLAGVELLGTTGSIVGVLFLVGCFFALGEEKQALHDKIAKTAIFHKEDIANMQEQPIAAATV
ncbi:MAG: RDD family protein [Bacteroidota bacterium]